MKAITRGILFYTFVLLFFMTAAAILFYGSGYRYNTSKNTIERTGELIVESMPSGAAVLLNGEPIRRLRDTIAGAQGASTPVHKKYLLPGTYHLDFVKDGYEPYRRDISVTSGTVTMVTDPVLLPRSEPEKIFSYSDIRQILVRTPNTVIFLHGTEEVIRYLVDTRTFEQLYRAKKDESITAFPTPTYRRALIATKSGLSVVEENAVIPLPDKDFTGPIIHAVWSDDEKSVFVLTRSTVIRIRTDGAQTTPIFTGVFADIALAQRTLYLLEYSEKKRAIILIDSVTGKKVGTRKLLPSENITTLEAVLLPLVIGKDIRGVITTIDLSDAIKAQTPLAYVQEFFSKTSQVVAVTSDFEALIFEKSSDKTAQNRLLARLSVPIQKLVMAKTAPYALLLSDSVLEALETANRPDQNRYVINSPEQRVRDFFFDDNGILYYIVETEDTTALFRKMLQNP
ncbi:PEGA domain-containing protein [Candidatus Uhrbacteria bacterium]|nr:PEGA domain-containing protein [Candidatus Uhrbacteria bacterium]